MLTIKRLVAATIAAGLSPLLFAAAAHADPWGDTRCDKNTSAPGCDVDASNTGGGGSSGAGGTGHNASGSTSNRSNNDPCTYRAAGLSPTTVAALGGNRRGQGGWYFKTCIQPDGTAVAYPDPVWITGPAPAISPEELASRARARLDLPKLLIAMNPAGDQLVNLPVWLGLDAASWRPRSATASATGVSVTATARPVRATWVMGDGVTVDCAGPGTAWVPGTDPLTASPDCGHTYRRSSATAPGGVYAVTVTVHWEVTWAGAGRSGTVRGLTTTGQVQARVHESQALV